MEHKNLLGQPLIHTMNHEQIQNHPRHDPCLTLGSSSFMHPSENITVCGLNSEPYSNTSSPTTHPFVPTFNLEVPCYAAAHAGVSQHPFMHSWSSCSSCQFPPYYIHNEPCLTQFNIGDINVAAHPPTGFDTVTYKRKIPTIHYFSQNASTNSCLNAGSSNHAVSAELLDPTQPAGPHCLPWEPIGVISDHRRNNPFSYVEDQRNIRCHNVNVRQPRNISLPIHTSNNFSEHLQSVAHTSGLNVLAQWNHAPFSLEPYTRLIPSEINQLHRHYVRNTTGEIDGYSNFCLVPNQPTRNMVVNSRIIYGQGVGYQDSVSYGAVGPEANLADMWLPSADGVVPPRYSRQLPTTAAIRNQSTFTDPRSLFDEHHDMRLDIDNMDYEELLALEEQIGNVSTGLSEDAISKCLLETLYYCDQRLVESEEGHCIICLEPYRNRDCLGRLKCGHDFHSCCIKQWLLIKNICPICKALALEDS
ncbi:hypothetical protein ZIOFF_046935 [Zingiber officinale]|uniref:RING-type E3 ubiquitin transferase n=1 Tax=Zingiber officinale TaxID=94328 RepID=A0A8J5KW99_ZINOF|nr:hypothetical protein ZIOFF_046935 [Zingiber officinale]